MGLKYKRLKILMLSVLFDILCKNSMYNVYIYMYFELRNVVYCRLLFYKLLICFFFFGID